MKLWPGLVAVAMLAGTWGLLQTLSHGEEIPLKKPFVEFPVRLADRWEGRDVAIEQKVLDVLKVSDYLMRGYVPIKEARGTGHEASPGEPIWLYVGYYQSQRTGATYHSPKNCLPGAGWQFVDTSQVSLAVPEGPVITINRAIIQKGLERELILYWYQDRGRVVASEYWAKGYMIWDAMTKNRTDGALVRVSLSVTGTLEAADQQAVAFVKDLWRVLPEYLPIGAKPA
jgi:EpsI family protein